MTQGPAIVRPNLTIDLDLERFELAAKAHDWVGKDGKFDYTLIARVLNCSERQAYRVLTHESRPGPSFIAELLTAAEESGFRRLFRIVDSAAPIGRK